MEEPQEELSAAQLKETKSNLQADAESTSSDVSPSAGDDVEAKLASYFPEFGKGGVPSLEQFRYAESDIQEISKLLRNMGNIPWSCVPRLYIVLRTASQLPLLDALIADEVTDTWFPFPAWMLPDSWDTLQRQHFARTQLIVLTKMTDLENGDFMDHKHLDEDAAAQLQTFDVLGTGWFAKVDKVQIPSHQDTFYARKSIYRRSSRKDSRNDLKYFENELKVLKSLVHHHIVKLIGSYTEPKFLGLILSPVAGCDLKAFLSQDSLSDSQRTLLRSFFGCLSAGLAYLHMQRVVHGDITPANILIHGENVLICGFLSSNDWSGEADSVTSGPWPRTPRYAALEVYDNECRGDFSDIWSLGCVFLVMLTRLRGKSLDVFAKIFAESGSKPKTFCANLEAIAFLLEVLEEADGPIYDNIPIRWIQEMLQEDHNCRPTAPELQKMILETGADTVPRNIFCGSCCAQIQSDRMGDSFQEEPAGVEASFIRDWDRIATNVSEICAGIPGSFERGSQGQQDELYLPQIVACGDQSSGKSSVLDAITGLTFPKNLVTCTRFATE
jgi:serine/threonine protein kinase